MVLLTILFQASGSVIRSGLQSIYRALILHRPLHGSSATSLAQIFREISFFGEVFSLRDLGRFPAVSELNVVCFVFEGQFLASAGAAICILGAAAWKGCCFCISRLYTQFYIHGNHGSLRIRFLVILLLHFVVGDHAFSCT